MKKLAILVSVGFMLCMATSSFAATTFLHNEAPTDLDNDLLSAYRTSTNVVLVAETSDDNSYYEVVAGHNQGNRMFASSSSVAQLFWATKDVGGVVESGNLPNWDADEVDPDAPGWEPL